MHNILARTITVIILAVVTTTIAGVVYGALDESSYVYSLSSVATRCSKIEQPKKDKKVIIRLDDIQAYALRNIQIRMINDALERNIPLSLSVIPYRLEEDKIMYSFLKKNKCNLEFAMHGWDNDVEHKGEIPEFGRASEEEAYERIMKGKPIIEELAGKPPKTFVPPNNEYSRATVRALARTGFSLITSEGPGPYYNYDASTYDFLNSVDNSNELVLSKCKNALNTRNLCIVMIHPQDYAKEGKLNDARYADYLALLDTLKDMDIQFETFESYSKSDKLLAQHWEEAYGDGIVTSLTDLAQCANYVPGDIIVDPNTYQHNVRVLQIFLKYLGGYPGLEINGTYNKATARAVITLRQRTGNTLKGYGLQPTTTQVPTKDLVNALYCISGGEQALARAISVMTPYKDI